MQVSSFDYFTDKKIFLGEDKFVFCFINKNILYIKNSGKIISINLESIHFAEIDFRNFLEEIFLDKVLIFTKYKNNINYINKNLSDKSIFLECILRVKNKHLEFEDLVKSNFKKENYFDILNILEDYFIKNKELTIEEKRCYKNFLIKDIATNILSNSFVFTNKKFEGFSEYKNGLFFKKLFYSNKNSLTGRITCSDKFNIQLLPKDSEDRKNVVSRFKDGYLINFDYSSFETVLSMYLSGNEEFIEKFIGKDLHLETAKIVFNKEIISAEERDFSKKINHAIVYGAGKNTILNMISSFSDKESKYNAIINQMSPILTKNNNLTLEFKEKGYIKNYFGTFIFPKKEYALYNNYIQSSASDIISRKIIQINSVLSGYKSKIVTSTHDNIIVDMSEDEVFLTEKILEVMKNIDIFTFKVNYDKLKNLSEKY
jgi:hypothetical protein